MSLRNIYRKIAKGHGVSVAEVKREMQSAIDYAYKKNDKSERERVIQESFSCKGEVPDAEDLINASVRKLKGNKSK